MTNYFLTSIGQNDRNGIENSTKKSLSIREIENAITNYDMLITLDLSYLFYNSILDYKDKKYTRSYISFILCKNFIEYCSIESVFVVKCKDLLYVGVLKNFKFETCGISAKYRDAMFSDSEKINYINNLFSENIKNKEIENILNYYFSFGIFSDKIANKKVYFNKNKYEVSVFFHNDSEDNFLYGIWNPNNENERFITIVYNRELDMLIEQLNTNNERNCTLEKALIKLNGRIGYVKSLYERSHFEDFEMKMKVVETLKKLNISLK